VRIKATNLSDRFEVKGYWWTPEKPERKAPGVLTYDAGVIELELFGSIRDQPNVQTGPAESVFTLPLVLGLAEGDYITLYRVVEKGRRFTSAGDDYSSFRAFYLIVGCHVLAETDLQFHWVRIRFAGLEEWLFQNPIEQRFTTEDERNVIHQTFRFPAAFEAELPELDARLETDYEVTSSQTLCGSSSLTYSAYFKIIPATEQTLKWFCSVAGRCRDFLTFCFGQAATYRQFLLNLGEIEVGPGVKIPHEAALFFRQQSRRTNELVPRFQDMILGYPQIQPAAPQVIANWFQKASRLETVIELFLGTYYNPDLYLRLQFLSLIQAIESYARFTARGLYLEAESYEPTRTALVAAIPAGTPDDLRSALKNKLKYGNEHSLRKRLMALFGTLGQETSLLVSDDPKKFIGEIVDTRNFFTHYTGELKGSALLEARELYEATHRLRLFLIVLLLKELGLEEPAVFRIILKNQRLAFIYTAEMNSRFQTESVSATDRSMQTNDEKASEPTEPIVDSISRGDAGTSRQGLADLLARIHAGQMARGYQGRTVEEMQTEDAQRRTEDEEYEERWRTIWGQTSSGPAPLGSP